MQERRIGIHTLIKMQLEQSSLNMIALPQKIEDWQNFIKSVDKTYYDFEKKFIRLKAQLKPHLKINTIVKIN